MNAKVFSVVVGFVVFAPFPAFAQSPPPATTPAPVPQASSSPPSTAASAPRPRADVRYFEGHVIVNPLVYNELNGGRPGAQAGFSFGEHGAVEFNGTRLQLGQSFDVMLSAQAHQWAYPHIGPPPGTFVTCPGNPGCVTTIGRTGQVSVAGFNAIDSDYSGHLGVGFQKLRAYVAGAYVQRSTNYGYPNQQGFGFGVEKLADVDRPIAPYGSYYYYPRIGAGAALRYRLQTYQIGVAVNLAPIAIRNMFLDVGFEGDKGLTSTDARPIAPSDFQHAAFYGGLGIRL